MLCPKSASFMQRKDLHPWAEDIGCSGHFARCEAHGCGCKLAATDVKTIPRSCRSSLTEERRRLPRLHVCSGVQHDRSKVDVAQDTFIAGSGRHCAVHETTMSCCSFMQHPITEFRLHSTPSQRIQQQCSAQQNVWRGKMALCR